MGKVFLTESNRRMIRVLLHYRHMFLYFMKHYPSEFDDFKVNVEYCEKWFEKITTTTAEKTNRLNKLIVELIQQTESSYGSHQKLIMINMDMDGKIDQQLSNSKSNDGSKKTMKKRKQTTDSSATLASKKQCRRDSEKKKTVKKRKAKSSKQAENDLETIASDDSEVDFGLSLKYICSYGCRYRSTSKDKVNKHEQIVHNGKQHKCLQKNCTEQFQFIFDLQKHLKQFHKIFQCSNEKCALLFQDEYVYYDCFYIFFIFFHFYSSIHSHTGIN